MNSSNSTSRKQGSLDSVFSLIKVNNYEKEVTLKLKFFKQFFEFFLFQAKIFYFSLKKNYFFQLLSRNKDENVVFWTDFFLLVKKMKKSQYSLMLFLNLPFFFSKIFSDIVESIGKKTIYIYRFFLLLSLPSLVFYVNNTFFIDSKKDSLLFLLPEKTENTFVSSQESLYLLQKKKKILRDSIVSALVKKIKSLNKSQKSHLYQDENSYFPLLPLTQIVKNSGSNNLFSSSPFFFNRHFSSNKIGSLISNRKFFLKWLTSYFYFKKTYSVNIESDSNNVNKKEINLREKDFFSLLYFSKNKTFKKEYLNSKFNHIFFTFIKPRNLTHLINMSVNDFLKKETFTLNLNSQKQQSEGNLSFFKSPVLDFSEVKKLQQKDGLSKKQSIHKIQNWRSFSSFQNNTNFFENNKFVIKRTFDFFQNWKFVFHLILNFWKKFLMTSLLNRSTFWYCFFHQPNHFQFRSYKDAINYTSFPHLLSNKAADLQNYSFFQKKNFKSNFFQEINFLYNCSLQLGAKSVLMTPEVNFFFKNTIQKPNESIPFLIKSRNLYDLDFYSKRNKIKETFFGSSNFYWEKIAQKDEKNKITSKGFVSLHKKKEDFSFLEQDLNLVAAKRQKIHKTLFLKRSHFLTNYSKWFFTSQWWLFRKEEMSIQLGLFFANIQNIKTALCFGFYSKFKTACKYYFPLDQKLKNLEIFISSSYFSWVNLFVEPLNIVITEKPFWVQVKITSSVKNTPWILFAWSILSSTVYYHWIPMLSGSIYLYLWLDFERIRSLCYPSWKTFLNILVHNSNESLSQELRLATYSSRTRIFYLYNTSYKFFNMFFSSIIRWNQLTTSDLSRRNKNLVSNCLITKKTLKTKYSFWNINQQGEEKTLTGSGFFEKWCAKNNRISFFLQKNQIKAFSFTQINDLLFYSKKDIFDWYSLSQTKFFPGKLKPTFLIESLIHTQRWLFIGSSESGKSFAIKNIAAGMNCPLIYISLKDIKNATPDIKYSKIKKQKRWLEQLSERGFFLENIFNLAKIVSPCILWVADLHEFDAKNQVQDKNTQKFDLSLLMAILLKILSIDLIPEKQNQITFIGSTEYPKLLDPKFISRQRLDLIVNFRTPSYHQRQFVFSSLLKNKGFAIQGLQSTYELSWNTLGYTFRDIISLVNETLLIKTAEKSNFVDSKNIRLAIYRKTSTQCVQSRIVRQDVLYYKIGKAIIQSILVYPKSIVFLSKYHDLWKTKFYYLSQTYLEPSNRKTITTEFVMLLQLVKSLAGSASRDVGLLLQHNLKQNSLALTSQVKHDLSLASTILQSLLVEFPMGNFQLKKSDQNKFLPKIFKTFHFQYLKRASSSLEFFDQSPTYIYWSNKGNRLSFNWFLLFGGLEQSPKNLTKISSLEKNKENSLSNLFEKDFETNLPYERRETKRQQQKIQKTDLLFTKMLWNNYIENLGFPWESDYIMNYNPFQVSLFFREARSLWNPQTGLPSYSLLFFDRDLLINQKMLTKLYITYGNKFQTEKLNRKRVKKQMLWANTAFVKQDPSAKTNFQNDFINDQSKDFYLYQNILNLNAYLIQSQLQLPVYFHQGWITEDASETFRFFDRSNSNFFLKNYQYFLKESFVFEILLEIYQYLFLFFFKNQNGVEKIKETLMKQEVLYWQDIEFCIKKNF